MTTTPGPITAKVGPASDPLPTNSVYAVYYPSNDGWDVGYTSRQRSWVETMQQHHPGSRLVVIDPGAGGGGLEWECIDPDSDQVMATFRLKEHADEFNDGSMIVRPRTPPAAETVPRSLYDAAWAECQTGRAPSSDEYTLAWRNAKAAHDTARKEAGP